MSTNIEVEASAIYEINKISSLLKVAFNEDTSYMDKTIEVLCQIFSHDNKMSVEDFKEYVYGREWVMTIYTDKLNDIEVAFVVMDGYGKYVCSLNTERVYLSEGIGYCLKFEDERTAYRVAMELQERTKHWYGVGLVYPDGTIDERY